MFGIKRLSTLTLQKRPTIQNMYMRLDELMLPNPIMIMFVIVVAVVVVVVAVAAAAAARKKQAN